MQFHYLLLQVFNAFPCLCSWQVRCLCSVNIRLPETCWLACWLCSNCFLRPLLGWGPCPAGGMHRWNPPINSQSALWMIWGQQEGTDQQGSAVWHWCSVLSQHPQSFSSLSTVRLLSWLSSRRKEEEHFLLRARSSRAEGTKVCLQNTTLRWGLGVKGFIPLRNQHFVCGRMVSFHEAKSVTDTIKPPRKVVWPMQIEKISWAAVT